VVDDGVRAEAPPPAGGQHAVPELGVSPKPLPLREQRVVLREPADGA
jgi:hypothetical protein